MVPPWRRREAKWSGAKAEKSSAYPQHVVHGAGVSLAQQEFDVVESTALAGPREPGSCGRRGEPLEAVMLRPEPHDRVSCHEGGEHRHQSDLISAMLVEQLDAAQVVEGGGHEAGLFLQLARSRSGGPLGRLDVTMNALP